MQGPLSRRWRRLFGRYRRSQQGATAIEFGMVAAPFLYLLMAIFETGIMLFSEYVIENGVARASRMIRTGQVQTQNLTASDFKNVVCGNLATFLDCQSNLYIDVRKFPDFESVSLPPPKTADGKLSDEVTTNAQFQPGDPLEVVVVRTYYEWQLFTPGITHLSNMADGKRLLAAGAAFRNEPYTTN